MCVKALLCAEPPGLKNGAAFRKTIKVDLEIKGMRGGSRPGAGRKSGSPNKASTARATKAKLSGDLPHEMLLAVARGQKVNGHTPTFDQQLEAMAKAAPYYAPRFASKVEHTGAGGGPITFADLRNLTDDQLAALEPVLSALAAAGAPSRASTH